MNTKPKHRAGLRSQLLCRIHCRPGAVISLTGRGVPGFRKWPVHYNWREHSGFKRERISILHTCPG
jgi:hypothetical protein